MRWGNQIGFKKGFTKDQLDDLIGIHPVAAEEFIEMGKLSTDKDPEKGAC